MKRKQALEILSPFIPSLSREYNRWGELTDKAKDRTWLYRDEFFRKPDAKYNDPDRERFLPEVIPAHFLEGMTATLDGVIYKVAPAYPERDYRRVYLEVMDFEYYGNTHKYGKLCIDGVSWRAQEGNGTIIARQLHNIEPRVSSIWDVDLCRIVADGEMDASECPAGESTARFVFLDELIATAAYVTILRVQGPCILDNGSSYAAVRKADDLLLKIDEKDEVTICPKLKRILRLK